MNSPFDSLSINDNTEIVLVSDLFSSDINGGAELTTEAIFERAFRLLQLPFFHVLAWRRGAPSQLLAPHGQVAVSTNWPCGHPVRPPGVIGGVMRT